MKENKIEISIIVPIYNSEKYLKKCIDSLINQTMKNIEIILINDGSTDNSEKIIKEYKDERIKYFKNKNQGIGKTRNFGIKKSSGKYLMFIDSDDYISNNCCEMFYNNIINNKTDMVVSNFYKDRQGIIEKIKLEDFLPSSIKENKDLLLIINPGPCNKLFRKSIIIDNNIYFEEEHKYEDMPFVMKYIKYARKISKLDMYLSYYCIHSNSETTIRDKRVFDVLKQLKIVRKEFEQEKYLKENLNIFTVDLITNYTIQQRYQKDSKIRNEFINQSFDFMRSNIPNYKNKKYYKGKNIIRRTIERNKVLTKLYCKITGIKYRR